ncbi:MAG: S8 family serine peptidase [Myxococcales bacterium]|nr:S8 family serine peptidase [Myxococcales bacterium]
MGRRWVVVLALLAAPTATQSIDPSKAPQAPTPPLVLAPSSTTSDSPHLPQAPSPGVAPYVLGQLMVKPPQGRSMAWLASHVRGEVVADIGRSGFGVLSVEDPSTAAQQLTELGAQPHPLARVVGADDDDDDSSEDDVDTSSGGLPHPWHLDGLPELDPGALKGIVVAVLDTGVAYEDRAECVQAPGLADVDFVAPADFIELDDHPNDDHQHGTHIASVIASQGIVPGVAAGVSILPVKVLDRHKTGTEWALVEGIHHAVDHGADVINMSLSFPLGYVPSPALADALKRAHEAGIVMVAAAGNDSAKEITWPAASRFVVAVGASELAQSWWSDTASYSNRGPSVDVLAPGGDIGDDANGDGVPDGILAETIHPGDPSRVGLWLYEGTSQAAAIVSGAAARLLHAGVAPIDVAVTLQQGGGGYSPWEATLDGTGAEVLDVEASLDDSVAAPELHVGLLPYITEGWFGTVPHARAVVMDASGAPVEDASVVATVYAAEEVHWTQCRTDSAGICTLMGRGSRTVDAWAFRADMVVVDGLAVTPGRLLFASEPGEVLLQAISDATPADGDELGLAVHWTDGHDPELDRTLLESWAVVDTGTGLLSSPLGIVFRPSHLSGFAAAGTLDVDLDGTGLLSSPLGFRVSLRTLTLDGTGLLSSPLGFRTMRLVGIDGTGLLSSPLGFHASMLFAFDRSSTVTTFSSGTGLLSSPLGFWGQPILLDKGLSPSVSLFGSAHEAALSAGGIAAHDAGVAPTSWLVASGLVDVGLSMAPAASTASGDVSSQLR